jgi:hypothetical protein
MTAIHASSHEMTVSSVGGRVTTQKVLLASGLLSSLLYVATDLIGGRS